MKTLNINSSNDVLEISRSASNASREIGSATINLRLGGCGGCGCSCSSDATTLLNSPPLSELVLLFLLFVSFSLSTSFNPCSLLSNSSDFSTETSLSRFMYLLGFNGSSSFLLSLFVVILLEFMTLLFLLDFSSWRF